MSSLQMGHWNDGVCSNLHFSATHRICILQPPLPIYLTANTLNMRCFESRKTIGRLDEYLSGTETSVGFGGSVMECPSILPRSDPRAWEVTKTTTHHMYSPF